MKLDSEKVKNAALRKIFGINFFILLMVSFIFNKANPENLKIFGPFLNVIITASITISIYYYTQLKERLNKIKKVEKIKKENYSNYTSLSRLISHFNNNQKELEYLNHLQDFNLENIKSTNMKAHVFLTNSHNVSRFTSIRIRQTLFLSYSKEHTDFFGHDETEQIAEYFSELKELLDLMGTINEDPLVFQITVLSRIDNLLKAIELKYQKK